MLREGNERSRRVELEFSPSLSPQGALECGLNHRVGLPLGMAFYSHVHQSLSVNYPQDQRTGSCNLQGMVSQFG